VRDQIVNSPVVSTVTFINGWLFCTEMNESDTQEFSVQPDATLLEIIRAGVEARRGLFRSRDSVWIKPIEANREDPTIDVDYRAGGDIFGVEMKLQGDFGVDQVLGAIGAYGGVLRNELAFSGRAMHGYHITREARGLVLGEKSGTHPTMMMTLGVGNHPQVALREATSAVEADSDTVLTYLSSMGRRSSMAYDAKDKTLILKRNSIERGVRVPIPDEAVPELGRYVQAKLGVAFPTQWKVEYMRKSRIYAPRQVERVAAVR
jgi:hypothetical protein